MTRQCRLLLNYRVLCIVTWNIVEHLWLHSVTKQPCKQVTTLWDKGSESRVQTCTGEQGCKQNSNSSQQLLQRTHRRTHRHTHTHGHSCNICQHQFLTIRWYSRSLLSTQVIIYLVVHMAIMRASTGTAGIANLSAIIKCNHRVVRGLSDAWHNVSKLLV